MDKNLNIAASNESQYIERICVFCFIPFYILAQYLNRRQKVINLEDLDAFFLKFEDVTGRHFNLPSRAFDHYVTGNRDDRCREEIIDLVSYLRAPPIVVAAMSEILTTQTREHMMLVATILNEDVLERIQEDVRLQKHPIFTPNY